MRLTFRAASHTLGASSPLALQLDARATARSCSLTVRLRALQHTAASVAAHALYCIYERVNNWTSSRTSAAEKSVCTANHRSHSPLYKLMFQLCACRVRYLEEQVKALRALPIDGASAHV
jgi:hypothetical protein